MTTLTTPAPLAAPCPPSDYDCEHLTSCDLCGQPLCAVHSDGADPHGLSDPIGCERHGIVHRECHRDACRSADCWWTD